MVFQMNVIHCIAFNGKFTKNDCIDKYFIQLYNVGKLRVGGCQYV